MGHPGDAPGFLVRWSYSLCVPYTWVTLETLQALQPLSPRLCAPYKRVTLEVLQGTDCLELQAVHTLQAGHPVLFLGLWVPCGIAYAVTTTELPCTWSRVRIPRAPGGLPYN